MPKIYNPFEVSSYFLSLILAGKMSIVQPILNGPAQKLTNEFMPRFEISTFSWCSCCCYYTVWFFAGKDISPANFLPLSLTGSLLPNGFSFRSCFFFGLCLLMMLSIGFQFMHCLLSGVVSWPRFCWLKFLNRFYPLSSFQYCFFWKENLWNQGILLFMMLSAFIVLIFFSCSFIKYCVYHSKIKSISLRHHVISSI